MPKARGHAGAGRRTSHLGLFDDLQPMLSVVDKRSADALEVLPLGPPRLLLPRSLGLRAQRLQALRLRQVLRAEVAPERVNHVVQ